MSVKELNTKVIAEASSSIGIDLNNNAMCILPFSHLSTTTNGEVRLCCRSKKIGTIRENSLLEVWNSKKLNQIRKDLLNGSRPAECQNCWNIEDKGLTSLREGQNVARFENYSEQIKNFVSNKDIELPTLELKLSNRCNLKCKMCSPISSSRWTGQWDALKQYFEPGYAKWVDRTLVNSDVNNGIIDLYSKNKKFQNEILKLSKDLRLLDFAGGEPLIDPIHYELLNSIIEHGSPELTTLRYSTNLTILAFEKFSVLDIWSKFKNVELTISIDGSKTLNPYIREGTNMEVLTNNIKSVKKLEKVSDIKCTTTVSAFNAPFIKDTAEFIIGELDCSWHSSRVLSPDFMDARVWPSDIKKIFAKRAGSLNLEALTASSKTQDRGRRHINDFVAWMQDDFNSSSSFNKFCSYVEHYDKKNSSDVLFYDLIDSIPEYKTMNIRSILMTGRQR